MCVCMSTCIYHPSEIIMSVSYNELQKTVAIFGESCTNLKSITIDVLVYTLIHHFITK